MALVLSLLMKLWQNVLHKLLEVDLAFFEATGNPARDP